MAAEDEQTCKIHANVHYKIIYAEMGFSTNLQRYIVQIEKSSRENLWKYNRKVTSEKQRFPVFASFQFVKVEQTDIDGADLSQKPNWWTLDDDLFYAFASKSAATALTTLASALAAAVVVSAL